MQEIAERRCEKRKTSEEHNIAVEYAQTLGFILFNVLLLSFVALPLIISAV